MKKTIKHLLYTILVIFIFIIPLCIAPIVKADSGWDSSYDSGGGSWDSGGDSWDSGGGSPHHMRVAPQTDCNTPHYS